MFVCHSYVRYEGGGCEGGESCVGIQNIGDMDSGVSHLGWLMKLKTWRLWL